VSLRCFDCGKAFKKGDTVFEFTSGTFDGEQVYAEGCFEAWCEDCETIRSER